MPLSPHLLYTRHHWHSDDGLSVTPATGSSAVRRPVASSAWPRALDPGARHDGEERAVTGVPAAIQNPIRSWHHWLTSPTAASPVADLTNPPWYQTIVPLSGLPA
jgi:hypothetical protein